MKKEEINIKKKIKVLILGADGQLAKTLKYHEIYKDIFKVYYKTRKSVNVTNYKSLKSYLQKIKPDYVVNSAAYTNVNKAEYEYKKCYLVNVKGPENLAKISKLMNCCLIHISTDYVFNGKKKSAYNEEDIPKPKSNYGLTKYLGDQRIINNTSKYIILRVAWLYGAFGNNFLKKIIDFTQLNESIKVVNDQVAFPTDSHQLSKDIWRVLKILSESSDQSYYFGLYNYGPSHKVVSRYTFVKAILKYGVSYGLKSKKIIQISHSDLESSKIRPKNSCLNNSKFNKKFNLKKTYWKSNLKEALKIFFNMKSKNNNLIK